MKKQNGKSNGRAGAKADSGRGPKDSGITRALRAKGFLLASDVAERLDLNKATVYRWVHDGKVRTVQFSGTSYIEWSSVVDMLGEVGQILGLQGDSPDA